MLAVIAVTLFLVMDPLGNIPVFLSILKKYSTAKQVRIIIRETVIAFVVLVIFLFFGRYIMHGLNISTSALSIAGGIILFLIAIQMIFPSAKRTDQEKSFEEPLIVPLAIPLTAGPSAIATVLLFASRDAAHLWLVFSAIVIAACVFLVIMLFSPLLMRCFGNRGLVAIERLMGMILTAVAVQMFLSGIIDFIQHPVI